MLVRPKEESGVVCDLGASGWAGRAPPQPGSLVSRLGWWQCSTPSLPSFAPPHPSQYQTKVENETSGRDGVKENLIEVGWRENEALWSDWETPPGR